MFCACAVARVCVYTFVSVCARTYVFIRAYVFVRVCVCLCTARACSTVFRGLTHSLNQYRYLPSQKQESKWKESIRYYDPIVHKNGGEQLLNVPAIVLANLCVSYIMTSQNEAAEELMRKIEKEEERLAFPDQRSVHHLCIVNLVIGTLYCAKGNFEFGIARIVKSLEPYDKKLGADTWYVVKSSWVVGNLCARS